MKKNKIIAVALLAMLGISAFAACKKANNDEPIRLKLFPKTSNTRNLGDTVVKTSPFLLK
jgi:hypothetical protein